MDDGPASDAAANPTGDTTPRELVDRVRRLKWDFCRSVEPYRPALYGYCRKLTGNPFDAEDLHQETLLRAFSRLSQRFEPIANVKAWLFRVATNLWIDATRRRTVRVVDAPEAVASTAGDDDVAALSLELVEAAPVFLQTLPRKEAMGFLLRDVFDLSVPEAAQIMNCSEASLKMAASRARRKLAERARDNSAASVAATASPPPAAELVARFAERFRNRDVTGLLELIDEHARAHVLGCAEEDGRDEIMRGSLHLALASTSCVDATVHDWHGQPVVATWYARDGADPVVRDLWRLDTEGERVLGLRLYYFSPELLAEAAADLGLPLQTNGYAVFERGWWNDQR